MKTLLRILLIVPVLLVLAFCVFGFIATFEELPVLQRCVWRTVYGLVGTVCVLFLSHRAVLAWRFFRKH